LRGRGRDHVRRVFLDDHFLDGVSVRDNDKTLIFEKGEVCRQAVDYELCMHTLERGAPRAGVASKTRPSAETKSA